MLARAATALALVFLAAAGPAARAVVVEPGEDVSAAARAGGSIVLAPGVHQGFALERSVTLRGSPGAIVVGEVRILSDDVTLTDVTIIGEENGVTVRDAGGITIERVTIVGATLHGIAVNDGEVAIRGCSISGLRSSFAQGIEIRNVVDRPGSIVEGCSIAGGQEGIVSHAARVEYRDNVVTGTTMRAFAVTEMSEGLVVGNLAMDVMGSGLYCGDMSHCEFSGNVVRGVRSDGTGVRTSSGLGVVAWYWSTLRDDTVVVDAPGVDVGVFLGSTTTDRFPLGTWPGGWTAAVPGAALSAAAIGLLFGLAVIVRPLARLLPAPKDGGRRAAFLLVWGFGVQSFHMLEHGIQVVQAKVINGRERQGLLGSHVDAEWLHLVFNGLVLMFLGWALITAIPFVLPRARSILLAAALVQTYHVTEHVFKVAQHASTGAKPTPGLIGGRIGGLVWFHFGINAVVYAGLLVAVTALLWLRLRDRAQPVPNSSVAVAA